MRQGGHEELADLLDWRELRVLLSEALPLVPAQEAGRWERVAAYVHERCPGSPLRPGTEFESALRKVEQALPRGAALDGDARQGREAWARLLYEAAQGALDASQAFLNFGYEDPLPGGSGRGGEDGQHRRCIQLYQRLVGTRDLRGQAVLEIGCGWGGGCAYVARDLHPRRVVGMDLVPANAARCRANHPGELAFVTGNAVALPFASGSFDTVLSLESSHAYPSLAGFGREVRRVLGAGGRLLLGDLRPGPREWTQARDELGEAGLEIEHEEDVSAGVLASIEAAADERDRALRAAERASAAAHAVLLEMVRLAESAADGLRSGRGSFLTLSLRARPG
jgi:SAM-dependent methyltransferase